MRGPNLPGAMALWESTADEVASECSSCRTTVRVLDGLDWEPGDRCHICTVAVFDQAEAMLKEIDAIVAPDRRGHRRRDALDRVQDLVMTRPWQAQNYNALTRATPEIYK